MATLQQHCADLTSLAAARGFDTILRLSVRTDPAICLPIGR